MAKKIGDRYSSAAALAEALDACTSESAMDPQRQVQNSYRGYLIGALGIVAVAGLLAAMFWLEVDQQPGHATVVTTALDVSHRDANA